MLKPMKRLELSRLIITPGQSASIRLNQSGSLRRYLPPRRASLVGHAGGLPFGVLSVFVSGSASGGSLGCQDYLDDAAGCETKLAQASGNY
jgi:hypothetical protein